MSLTTLHESDLESDFEYVGAPQKPEKRSSVDSTTSTASTSSWTSSSSSSGSRMKRISTRFNGLFNGETLRTSLIWKCTYMPPIGSKRSSIDSTSPPSTTIRRSSSTQGLNRTMSRDILKAAPVATPDYLMDLVERESTRCIPRVL